MSKKLLVAAVAVIGGALAYRKVNADRNAEQNLWAEATDRVR
ncbi:MAG: DLW-39 family protein [Actinomycetes bacterium]